MDGDGIVVDNQFVYKLLWLNKFATFPENKLLAAPVT